MLVHKGPWKKGVFYHFSQYTECFSFICSCGHIVTTKKKKIQTERKLYRFIHSSEYSNDIFYTDTLETEDMLKSQLQSVIKPYHQQGCWGCCLHNKKVL